MYSEDFTTLYLALNKEEFIVHEKTSHICSYAFYNNTKLKRISIPKYLNYLDSNIIVSCHNLETIHFELESYSHYLNINVF